MCFAFVVELVDTQDFGECDEYTLNLSALLEMIGVEFIKVGEGFKMLIPSQALLERVWKV